MKFNQWTLALASVGVVSLGSVAQAEEQHSVMTALSSTTISGYVDTSVNWMRGDRGALPGRSFDGADKQDGFNLNVVKLSLEKPLDEAVSWSAGYKADLVFGPDANYYTTLLNGTMAAAPSDDFAVKQAYVALRAPVGNGLDFKMGVFDTLVGYEYFESGSNPNFSRSYGYFIEPTHHTGLLASYNITEGVAVTAGLANSAYGPVNDKHIDQKYALLAAISVTLPEAAGPLQGSSFTLGYVGGGRGINSQPGGSNQDVRNYYAGANFNLGVEGLSLGVAADYRQDFNNPALPATATLPAWPGDTGDNDAYALAVYLGYGVDKWSVNLRADYISDGANTLIGRGTTTLVPERRDELGSVTLTLGYSLWENVLTRLEGRIDHAFEDERPFGASDQNAFTLALNAVYKF